MRLLLEIERRITNREDQEQSKILSEYFKKVNNLSLTDESQHQPLSVKQALRTLSEWDPQEAIDSSRPSWLPHLSYYDGTIGYVVVEDNHKSDIPKHIIKSKYVSNQFKQGLTLRKFCSNTQYKKFIQQVEAEEIPWQEFESIIEKQKSSISYLQVNLSQKKIINWQARISMHQQSIYKLVTIAGWVLPTHLGSRKDIANYLKDMGLDFHPDFVKLTNAFGEFGRLGQIEIDNIYLASATDVYFDTPASDMSERQRDLRLASADI